MDMSSRFIDERDPPGGVGDDHAFRELRQDGSRPSGLAFSRRLRYPEGPLRDNRFSAVNVDADVALELALSPVTRTAIAAQPSHP